MKVKIIAVGKTTEKYIALGLEDYINRIKRYIDISIVYVPEARIIKRSNLDQFIKLEQNKILKQIDCKEVFLLDQRGKMYNSEQFAAWLQGMINRGVKCLNFVIGGAYGFTDDFRKRYKLISLSPMTFSHQLVRLVFVEQLYRSLTIIFSQPYHH